MLAVRALIIFEYVGGIRRLSQERVDFCFLFLFQTILFMTVVSDWLKMILYYFKLKIHSEKLIESSLVAIIMNGRIYVVHFDVFHVPRSHPVVKQRLQLFVLLLNDTIVKKMQSNLFELTLKMLINACIISCTAKCLFDSMI